MNFHENQDEKKEEEKNKKNYKKKKGVIHTNILKSQSNLTALSMNTWRISS